MHMYMILEISINRRANYTGGLNQTLYLNDTLTCSMKIECLERKNKTLNQNGRDEVQID